MNRLPLKEKDLHKAVCTFLKLQYPTIMWNSDMSGLKMTIGMAVQSKNMRSQQGYPDLVIYEPRKGYHALFIELKREGERIWKKDGSPATLHIAEQAECMWKLDSRGYATGFAIGFDDAVRIIRTYLDNDK